MHARDRERSCKRGMAVRRIIDKTAVMGMLDRECAEVRVKVIPDVTRATLQAEILKQRDPCGNGLHR